MEKNCREQKDKNADDNCQFVSRGKTNYDWISDIEQWSGDLKRVFCQEATEEYEGFLNFLEMKLIFLIPPFNIVPHVARTSSPNFA